MYRQLSPYLAAVLLVGLLGSGCGSDDPQPPPPPGNNAPVLTGPSVSAPEAASGATVQLALTASDADGDTLTYAWTQTPPSPAGTFSDAAAASPTWTAPQVTANTPFQLRVTVTDGKGGSVSGNVTVTVRPPPVSNRAPTLAQAPTATPTSVEGPAPVQLSVTASDPDNDPLTYTWTQEPASPAGAFTSTSTSNPTWTSPTVTAATRFTLRVTVSDNKGGSVQGEVEVDVAPPPAQNRAPTLTAGPTSSAPSVNGQQSVTLAVSASDPDNDPLTYSWTQTPASPAGAFSSTTLSNPSWTSPQVAADTDFQLRVTVSDNRGGSVTGTVTVRVLAPVNRNPAITQGPGATPGSVTGTAPVQLSVTASDPDNDPLTYAWTQEPASPAGTFSSTSTSNPTWTSPTVAANTRFTLRVTVSDNKGGSTQGQAQVDVAPPIPQNRPPTLTPPLATPSTVDSQGVVSLTVSASDPDNDPITYLWTQEPATPAGTFNDATVSNPIWISPRVGADTNFQLRATVSDGRGGTANDAAAVTVRAYVNTVPTIDSGPSASSTTVNEQQSITLSVTASDVDGDTLTYAWTQTSPASPVGTFSNSAVSNPTWTAPDVNANGTYTLRVTISDGQGGSVPGTININVQKVNQAPVVAANITGPNTLAAGTRGSFSITASDPDGDALTYTWSQTAPATQGTFEGGTMGANKQWFSPVVGAETQFTLSVSVTDGQSAAVVRTITLPVTVPLYSSVQSIWNTVPNCTICHGGSGGLSLAAASSHANLVNVNTNNAACNTLKRVAPGDPDNSALVRKMEGTTCGTRMPSNNVQYFTNNPELLVRVRSWILGGAANN
jgi:hypothetical protein